LSAMHAAALSQGSFGARGGFADTLEALIHLLGERARDAFHRKDAQRAAAASKAVDSLLRAETWTETNVSPQLIASKLIRDLSATLKRPISLPLTLRAVPEWSMSGPRQRRRVLRAPKARYQ